MSRAATRVAADFFNTIQLDAGVLVKGWDPTDPFDITDSMIITATSGGVTTSCVPTFSDLFADVDNAPEGTKEGKHLDKWDCSIATTALNHNASTIRLALGVADANSGKITPRAYIDLTKDFEDNIAWIGDMANGGLAAVVLKNALSTGGYSLKTAKNGKGTIDLTIAGHPTTTNINMVPMDFYVVAPAT